MARESPHHDPVVGEPDECDGGSVESFIVLGQAPERIELREGGAHDPFLRDDLESLGVRVAFDDCDFPIGTGHGLPRLLARVGAIGEYPLQKRKVDPRGFVEHQPGSVTVQDVGRMDRAVQDRTEGVGQKTPFLALDLLSRVPRVEPEDKLLPTDQCRTPSFCALCAVAVDHLGWISRLRPLRSAGGMSGLIKAHASSNRSLGQRSVLHS